MAKNEIKTRRACSECQGSFDQADMVKLNKQFMCQACAKIFKPEEEPKR